MISQTYLSVHEQMSHQSHGFPQCAPLSGEEGLVLISQAIGTRHHELSDLVIQAVERLNGCKGRKAKIYMIVLFSVWTLESQTLRTRDKSCWGPQITNKVCSLPEQSTVYGSFQPPDDPQQSGVFASSRPPGFQLQCGAGGGCSRRGGRLPRDCTLNSNTHCAQTCRDNSTLLQKITRCHTHAHVSRHTLAPSVHITIKMQDSAAEMRRPALLSPATQLEILGGAWGM